MRRIREIRLRAVTVAAYRSVRDLTEREKRHLLSEIVQVKGLMPLLMKPRNNQRWTPEDRAELRCHLRRLSAISPYLVVLALPGSFLMLPMLAWWLDRRRNRKRPPDPGVPAAVGQHPPSAEVAAGRAVLPDGGAKHTSAARQAAWVTRLLMCVHTHDAGSGTRCGLPSPVI